MFFDISVGACKALYPGSNPGAASLQGGRDCRVAGEHPDHIGAPSGMVGRSAPTAAWSNRSRADEYYLGGGGALAEFCVVDGSGEVVGFGGADPRGVRKLGGLDQPLHE